MGLLHFSYFNWKKRRKMQ